MESTKLHLDFQAKEQSEKKDSSNHTQINDSQQQVIDSASNVIELQLPFKNESIDVNYGAKVIQNVLDKNDKTVTENLDHSTTPLEITVPFNNKNQNVIQDEKAVEHTLVSQNVQNSDSKDQNNILNNKENKEQIVNPNLTESVDEFDKIFIDDQGTEAFSDILPFTPNKVSNFGTKSILKPILYVGIIIICLVIGLWLLLKDQSEDMFNLIITDRKKDIADINNKVSSFKSHPQYFKRGVSNYLRNIYPSKKSIKSRINIPVKSGNIGAKSTINSMSGNIQNRPDYVSSSVSIKTQDKKSHIGNPPSFAYKSSSEHVQSNIPVSKGIPISNNMPVTTNMPVTNNISKITTDISNLNPYWDLPNELLSSVSSESFTTISEEELLALKQRFNHQYNYQRYLVVEKIRMQKIKGAESILWEALSSNKFWIRMNAILALIELGYKMDLYYINQVLEDQKLDLVFHYFKRFEKPSAQTPEVLYFLRHAIKLVDDRTRYSILKILNNVNDNLRIYYLQAALKDPSKEIRRYAQIALNTN